MKQLVCLFKELTAEHKHLAGGKGGTLAYLYQKGYPVPNGFIIMQVAFEKDELIPEAWAQVQAYLKEIRQGGGESSFAVRSSALSEDSAMASFAGQFDTVLDVSTDNEVANAIRTVRKSRHSKQVQVYSEIKGINESHDNISVVIQQMVKADISGVLFTADPLTGNRNEMAGNFIFGLGEKLVSGQVTAYTFKLGKKTGIWRRVSYDGPLELKKFAGKLEKMGNRLEKEMGCPQDIEWSIAGGTLYLLQSRPVTTLIGHNPTTGECNDSMTGNYLWSNVNFGEAIPQVMTPLTWTVQQQIFESWKLLPGYQSSGNIGGRIYLNLSIYASVLSALGKNKQGIMRFLEGLLYTRIPENMEIPLIPLSKRSIVSFLFNFVGIIIKQIRTVRELPRFLSTNPTWCNRMQKQIHETKEKAELTFLWHNEILPHLKKTVWSVMGSVTQFSDYTIKLRRELIELLGPEDADTFISGLSSSSDVRDGSGLGSGLLASLGPVLGIAKLARREIDRTEYIAQYGHRGPNEFELSVPRPSEDRGWLDQQLAQFEKSPIDVEALLIKRRAEFATAWNRFETSHPRKVRSMKRRINKVAPKARMREAVRSEYVRDRWVARNFALRAGQLTGLGEDIYFLTIEEVLNVLSGDEAVVKFIPARKDIHGRYSSLPAYPSIICGRFDPFLWAVDPKRRNDIYNASASDLTYATGDLKSDSITGSPGSAGRIEGVVRRLNNPEEGGQLQKGEILVTTQTDIAWTPLFPRAGAIVTDVGAPLSHAAIVARELGIPAVVGCGNATMRLQTGDRVLVDGGQGVVMIL